MSFTMDDRASFGPSLRKTRLSRGISLKTLSVQTKVNAELWEDMERGDLSQWPAGIYARAYIRAYAEAVGLDPGSTVDEFCRLFPQGDRRSERLLRGHADAIGHPLVWTNDLPPGVPVDRRAGSRGPSARPWLADPRHARGVAAAVDAAVVLTAGAAGATVFHVDAWIPLALVALAYHGLSLVFIGSTPAVAAIDAYLATRPELRRRGDVTLFRSLATPRDR